MAKVTLFYRDANNYKCQWDTTIPDGVIESLPAPDENDMHLINDLGLTMYDIPLIQKYGFDPETDYPYVTIESFKLDKEK